MMYVLVNGSGEVLDRKRSFDKLQDKIDAEMMDAWVLSEDEYKAIYKPDEFFGENIIMRIVH